MVRICNININGLNDVIKQKQVIDFMKYYKIDIFLLQEHNIRNHNVICSELDDFCFVILNLSVCHKGGTAILIDKRFPVTVISEEFSADSRILSVKFKLYNKILHLVNIYAHSRNRAAERDNLFNVELLYYLRNNLHSTYIAGDWNCMMSDRVFIESY